MGSGTGKWILATIVVTALVVAYILLKDSPVGALFMDSALLRSRITAMGIYGPLLIVGLMTLAIVFNPLPSAPIALAAGALYGHTLGTVYIVVGAELGAILAFFIARVLGADLVKKLGTGSLSLGRFGSQNSLTMIVFVSRLVPFMSFDLVSYAAGLTPLRFWRFALATLFGLMPISFALAHFGGEIVAAGDRGESLTLYVLLAGLILAAPLLIASLRGSRTTDVAAPDGTDHSVPAERKPEA